MDVKITQAAKDQITKIENPNHYLRIILERSGCCSLAFMAYEDKKKAGDQVIEAEGCQLLITEKEKGFMINGFTIDYGRKGIRKDFLIKLN